MSWKSRTLRQSYGTLSLLEEAGQRGRESVGSLEVNAVASVRHDDQLRIGQGRQHLAAELAVPGVERADQQQGRQPQLAQSRLERRWHPGSEAAQAVRQADRTLSQPPVAHPRAQLGRQPGLAGEERDPLPAVDERLDALALDQL